MSTSCSTAPIRETQPTGRNNMAGLPYAALLLVALLVGAAVLGGWTGVVVVVAVASAIVSTWLSLFTESSIGA